MSFLVNCTNKGCGKTNIEGLLDLESNEVVCPECDKSISNLTSFTKSQLKSAKQIKKPKKEPFSVKCPNCSTDATPKLIGDHLMCVKCSITFTTIPKSYEMLVRNHIKNKDSE